MSRKKNTEALDFFFGGVYTKEKNDAGSDYHAKEIQRGKFQRF